MKQGQILNFLPWFNKELADEIDGFAEIMTFHKDDLIMKSGQDIYSSMLIINGLVEIFQERTDWKQLFMYYLHPGQGCALSNMCGNEQEISNMLAMAAGDTKMIAIPFEFRDRFLFKHKHWYCLV